MVCRTVTSRRGNESSSVLMCDHYWRAISFQHVEFKESPENRLYCPSESPFNMSSPTGSNHAVISLGSFSDECPSRPQTLSLRYRQFNQVLCSTTLKKYIRCMHCIVPLLVQCAQSCRMNRNWIRRYAGEKMKWSCSWNQDWVPPFHFLLPLW